MDNYGILSLAPALIAVILAFITREALFSILCGVLVGLLITGQDLLFGFTGIIQSALGNADFIWVIGIEVFIGIMVAFFQKSGAIEAVANKLNEKLHITPRIAQIMGAALGILVFFSDYFSPLFVGNVMRPITDKAKVSREKLAWLCDCTSAPVCITLPFTAWGVYVAGLVVGFGTFATAEAGQDAVIHSIPFQLYGILTIVMIFLVALGFLPDYGPMKKAEDRALLTGKLFRDGAEIRREIEQEDLPEGAKPSIWNMLVPVIVLLVFIFVGLFYTGDIKTNGFFGALANGSSLRALDTAFILASIAAIIMGMISKVWNFKKALSTFIEGCTGMMEVLMILMLAWGIGSICSACGTSTWIVNTCESFLTPTSMCAIIFIATCLTSFSTGSSWSVFAIFIPIAVPLAISIGAPVGMAIGVVLSGGIFGDHCSPISDTTVMSSMGSSCDHIDHVRTQLPYALTVAGSSLVGYVVSGLMKGGAFVGLAITLVLICLVSFLLNKHVGRGKDAKAPQDAA